MRLGLLLVFLYVFGLPSSISAQIDTFDCDATYYLSQYSGPGTNTTLYQITLNTGGINFIPTQTFFESLNSIGYNKTDNLIYGVDIHNNVIYRMYADGTVDNLGYPTITASGSYPAGAVDGNGIFTIAGGSPKSIVRIDVSGASAIKLTEQQLYYSTGTTGQPVFHDFSYHPHTGTLYGYDENTNKLCTISPTTGAVNDYGNAQFSVGGGAMFFDAFGNLYSYDNSELNMFDLATGEATVVSSGPSASWKDGCSCPYTVQMYKSVNKDTVCAGDTLRYDFSISNSTSMIVSGVTFVDYFHPEFNIVEISDSLDGNVVSGIGSNVIEVQNGTIEMSSQLQTTDFFVKVVVDSGYTGSAIVNNQAYLTNTPPSLKDTIYSDDPKTGEFGDSTQVYVTQKVYSYQNFAEGDTTVCIGENVVLGSSLAPGKPHQWSGPSGYNSNGWQSNIQNINPSGFGYYHVEADVGGCQIKMDSVLIQQKYDCKDGYGCSNNFLHSALKAVDTTGIGVIDLSAGGNIKSVQDYNLHLEALGHNWLHQLVYGYNKNDQNIYRVFSNGSAQAMGIPPSATSGTGSYEAGACDQDGNYYITGTAGELIKLDVSGSSVKELASTNLSYASGGGIPEFGDIAFHPKSNTCYGFDEQTNTLCTIDMSTGVTTAIGTPQPAIDIEALYFDALGRLYGSGDTNFYQLNIASGEVELVAEGLVTNESDGCSCPYEVKLWKRVDKPSVCAGDTLTYELIIANRSGKPVNGGILYDDLHNWLTITSVESNLGGAISGGQGTSLLIISNITIPEDTVSVKIKAVVNSSVPGGSIINNQALLYNLPGKYDSVWSDNPTTLGLFDQTTSVVNGQEHSAQTEILCEGDSFYAEGTWQITPGKYTDTFAAVTGCDSIVDYYVNFNPTHYPTQEFTTCEGDSVYAAGVWRKNSGTYYDSLTNQYGCDSIIAANVTIYSNADTSLYHQICEGDSSFINNEWQHESGTFYDTLQSAVGCDSVVTTNFTVSNVITDSLTVSMCAGDSVYVADQWVTQPGYYYDTLQTQSECDSVLIREVTVQSLPEYYRQVDICENDSFFVADGWQSSAGTYRDTFPRMGACDSVMVTELKLLQFLQTHIDTSTCEGEPINLLGQWRSSSGEYQDTLTAASGCDSIVTINLSVKPVVKDSISTEICQGDSLGFGNGHVKSTGIYFDTLSSSQGCDSIVRLSLLVNQQKSTSTNQFICASDSTYFGGQWRKTTGIYRDTMLTTKGCDSVVTLNLQVGNQIVTTLDTAFCQGEEFNFGGEPIAGEGTYYDTLSSASGCDSIVELHVSINSLPTPLLGNDTAICNGESVLLYPGNFSSYQWSTGSTNDSITVSTEAQYSVTVSDVNGCQAADTTSLTVQEYPAPNLPNDTVKCPGQMITLSGSNMTNTGYAWNTGETTREIQVAEGGQYWVRQDNGCVRYDTIMVKDYDTVAVAMHQDTMICKNDQLLLDARTAKSADYHWSTGSRDSAILVFNAGQYSVTVTDVHGCKSSDGMVLTKFQCNESLSIPNAFSPNGDGVNDVFKINSENYKLTSVSIYNRWGERIFFAPGDEFEGWDGTKNGQVQPIGSYVVIVRYLTRYNEERKNVVNLLLIR